MWAGYWAPWIAHRAVALQWNGYELAEWSTRLPGVRDGSLGLGRLDFLAPLSAISLLTALAAYPAIADRPPAWLRWPAGLLALLGAFAVLPEYPDILIAHADAELRPRLILGLATVLATAAILVSRGRGLTRLPVLPRYFTAAARWILVAIALGFTVRALVVVRPALAVIFDAAPRLNWGPVALLVGLCLVWAAELGASIARTTARKR